MAKYGTNSEVVHAFAQGDDAPYSTGNGNIYFVDNGDIRVLYSYGDHFPLAVITKDFTLLNGDRYSVTTSQHQSLTRQAMRDGITSSFGMLRTVFGDGFYEQIKVIDTQDEKRGDISWQDEITLKNLDPEIKKIATSIMVRHGRVIAWHRAGAMLIDYKGDKYICGMDENQYFISKLPIEFNHVTKVESAFFALEPQTVREQRRAGKTIERQGEWFFTRIDDISPKECKKAYKCFGEKFELPKDDPDSNAHTATRGGFVMDLTFPDPILGIKADDVIVSGQIRHSQHRTLKLSKCKDPTLWTIHKNTAVESWSASDQGLFVD